MVLLPGDLHPVIPNSSQITRIRGLPCGPVVKNLPFNARDVGSIPDWGTKIPKPACQSVCCNKDPVIEKLFPFVGNGKIDLSCV